MQKICFFNFVLLFSFRLALPALGQDLRASIWYFGFEAGLDFRSGKPVALSDGRLINLEGCASIADRQGNLLFYTNGIVIWNREHQPMPNSKFLKGHDSSTQSALIVPKPGNDRIYYVFTSDAGPYLSPPNDGLHYSVVDMSLDAGRGDVVASQKNIFLYAPATEKLCAVQHANGEDVWVMTHEWENNRFVAYLVTAQGLSQSVVYSSVGTAHGIHPPGKPSHNLGYMKFSPNGKSLALACLEYDFDGFLEVFDFDNASGQLSRPLHIKDTINLYGVEFSPNGRFLYASTELNANLYQFDLSLGTLDAIRQSQYLLHEGYEGFFMGALQLAPDGKIYLAQAGNQGDRWLGVIDEPNQPGKASKYRQRGALLEPKASMEGLPNFPANYFDPVPSVELSSDCVNNAYTFFLSTTTGVTAVEWTFGDPRSSDQNRAVGTTAAHRYDSPGSYTVEARGKLGDSSVFSRTRRVQVALPSGFSLGGDTVLCLNTTLTLRAPVGEGLSYRWQDGSTAPSRVVSQPGSYSLEVSSRTCTYQAAINITFNECPDFTNIPNAFTPNGDVYNQTWVIEGLHLGKWQLRIYNRMGKEIFASADYRSDWDAEGQGNGLYYYMLRSSYSGRSYKGWVQVLR